MSDDKKDDSSDIPIISVDSLPSASPQHSEDWLAEMDSWIKNRRITTDSQSDDYFVLIGQCYPIGFNRIDWRRVKNHASIQVVSSEIQRSWDDCRQALRDKESSIRSWLTQCVESVDQEIIAVGDIADVALRMEVSTFFECYDKILVSGQHVYVLPSSGIWCLNYTMEDQLFFGLSKNAEVVGQIPYGDDLGG